MDQQDLPFRSGFIAIAGKPNVGKSTLTNVILGQPIAGVSAKPQTTRKRQLAIRTTAEYQMIFVDTPGLHEPKDKLSQFINSEAVSALSDADLILFLVDGSQKPDEEDRKLADLVHEAQKKDSVLLVINRIDLVDGKTLSAHRKLYQALFPEAPVLQISAQTGKGISELIDSIAERLPEGPMYFPEEQITQTYERDIAAELIRAACMDLLEDELPYSIAVHTDEYSERENGVVYIKATIFVERDAQKAIVIGRNGEMIKRIGTLARTEIEAMNGKKVFLELYVKTRKNWKNDPAFLREVGFTSKRS